MKEINFNQLKRLWNLKLVAETGSIKRAAIRANVTSSAMSQSITTLEEFVGRKLLLRKKDQLLPTEFGLQLLNSAGPTFGMCADLQKKMSGTGQVFPKIAWLDFAATESLAIDLLPELMKRLRQQFPGIRLKTKSGRSSDLTKQVKKAELCMAVVEDNDFIEGMTAIPISEDRLGLYRSSRLAESSRKSFIEELGIATLAAGPDGHPTYYTKFLKPLGKSFKPTLASDSYEILRAAAVEGSVVSILPSRVAQRRPGELTEVFLNSQPESKGLGRYKIYLVSEPGCTPEENIFLAEELQNLISGQK